MDSITNSFAYTDMDTNPYSYIYTNSNVHTDMDTIAYVYVYTDLYIHANIYPYTDRYAGIGYIFRR